MSEEKYTPEEVIETEGPNKANIKAEYVPGEYIEVNPDSGHKVGDETQVVDGLPRIGADAENKKRSTFMHQFSRFTDLLQFKDTKYSDGIADDVGTEAMADEINRRANNDLQDKGVSPHGVKVGGEVAANKFKKSQEKYTQDRVMDEVKENLE